MFLDLSCYIGIRATASYPRMTDGTRAQEIQRWEVSYKQLKETTKQQSSDLKEWTCMVTALNLKFNQSAKNSKDTGVSIEGGSLIPTRPRTGFNPHTSHTYIQLLGEKIQKDGCKSAKYLSSTTRCQKPRK